MSSRSHWYAALWLLAITVVFYWKIVLTNQYSMLLGLEGANQAYAWFNFWVSTVRQGLWPIWDPFTFSGHSFVGEMQAGAFYPPYALFLAAPFQNGAFSPHAYHAFFILTHALCAWLMYLLAREFRLSFFAAIVAGCLFSLGGLVARFFEWPHMMESSIWLPLILLLLMRSLKSATVPAAFARSSLCGLALAMTILAGGLHLAMMDAIVIASAAIFWAATARSRRDESNSLKTPWTRAAMAAAVALVFGLAGGAVQLLPSMEYSRLALRFLGSTTIPAAQKIPYNYMNDALWPQGFLTLFVPALAGPAGSGEVLLPYMSVFAILLAVIGVWKTWDRLWVRYLSGLVLFACLYALGPLSLLHGFLYAVTPYLWMAREASRFMYLANFGFAVLAGFGVDALFSGHATDTWNPLTRVLKWIAAGALIALTYPFILGKGDLFALLSLSLLVILLTYCVYYYVIHGHNGPWARVLVLAVILFDLSAFDLSAKNRIVEAAAGHDFMARLSSFRGAADFLRSRPGPFRVDLPVEWQPNIGDVYHIDETWGAGVTVEADYDRVRGHTELLNARYTVRNASAKEPGAVYQDSAWKIYENPNAYPRAWLVHQTVVENDPQKLPARLDQLGANTRQVALLRKPLDVPLQPSPAGASEEAQVLPSRQDQVEVDVHAAAPALLVLSDVFYPGWKATVNGQPARIWNADVALEGVEVPAGDSRVSLRYQPSSFYTGLTLTLNAFVAAGILGLGVLRRKQGA